MPDNNAVEIRFNPPDLLDRFGRYPQKLNQEMRETMDKALAHVQDSVPPYPAQGADINYVRTYTLGKTIGSGGGQAEIREIKTIGKGVEGKLGTRLYYAPYVIGDPQARNIQRSSSNWWTITQVARKAEAGVVKLFNGMGDRLAKWLDGR